MLSSSKVVLFTVLPLFASLLLISADVPAAPPASEKQTVVLDTGCVWRIYGVMKPPVIEPKGGGAPKPFLAPRPWLNWESPEPPAGWMKPDFDDNAWLRSPAIAPLATPYLSRLCMRAEFTVGDPAKAGPMSLELCYHGGAVVYVNGQEVGRGNLPVGELPVTALAEGYTRDAYVTEKDELVPGGWMTSNFPKQVALRKRWLKGIAVPAKLLRAGTNVLAVEIVRAPYNQVIEEKRFSGKQAGEMKASGCPYQITWGTCQFQDIQLTSAGGDGVVAKTGPKAGFQVRNSDILNPSDRESDLTAQPDVLGPMAIVAARNGAFSGKVIIGSAQAIRGLKATCGELKSASGTIPASAIQVRYGVSWGSDMDKAPKPPGLDILLESPPKEVSPGKNGALAAVWVTVHVPANAVAGEYTGQLVVEADGGKPVSVPVAVKVADFALPNTQDYRTWIDMIESPDSLAIEANVPLWSDKHWELIAKSMAFMGQTGCRIAYVPLIVHTNLGNEQSMVRWVKKGDKYEYDYSIMDKYLDTVEKHMGKPKMVVFQAWEIYLTDQVEPIPEADGENGWQTYLRNQRPVRRALRGKGPGVTVFDPSTGKTDIEYVGPYADPKSKAIWRPIFDYLHKDLAKRGYESAMMLGLSSDMEPGKADVSFLKEVSGDLPWVTQSHGGSGTGIKAPNVQYSSNGLEGGGRVGYATNVWDVKFNDDPLKDHMYGWKLPYLIAQHDRFGYFNLFPPTTLRCESEFEITGAARHGADRGGLLGRHPGQARAARRAGPGQVRREPVAQSGSGGGHPRHERRRTGREHPLRGPSRGGAGLRGPHLHRASPYRPRDESQARYRPRTARWGHARPSPPVQLDRHEQPSALWPGVRQLDGLGWHLEVASRHGGRDLVPVLRLAGAGREALRDGRRGGEGRGKTVIRCASGRAFEPQRVRRPQGKAGVRVHTAGTLRVRNGGPEAGDRRGGRAGICGAHCVRGGVGRRNRVAVDAGGTVAGRAGFGFVAARAV